MRNRDVNHHALNRFAALAPTCSTPVIGRNLKVLLYCAIPFAYLLWFALSRECSSSAGAGCPAASCCHQGSAAELTFICRCDAISALYPASPSSLTFPAAFIVALASVLFAFGYPGYLTADAYVQRGKLKEVPSAGFGQTFEQMASNVVAYSTLHSIAVPEWAHAAMVASLPPGHDAVDIHPGNWIMCGLSFLLVTLCLALPTLLLAALKLVPMLLRAYAAHFAVAGFWFRSGGKSSAAWIAYLFALPIVAAASLPAALLWSAYIGWKAAAAVIAARGSLEPVWPTARDAFVGLNKSTTRYIMGQDVPFYQPSGNTISLAWFLAAAVVALVGLVALPLPLLCFAILFTVPVIVSATQPSSDICDICSPAQSQPQLAVFRQLTRPSYRL